MRSSAGRALYPRRRAGGRAQRVIESRVRAAHRRSAGPGALKDAKTRLQEYLQSRGHALPRYAVEAHRRRAARADLPGHLRRSRARASRPKEQRLQPPPRRAGGGARRRYRRWDSMSEQDSNTPSPAFPQRLRGAGRPAQRRQVDAAQCAGGREARIVTSRPQTTRHRVLGIANRPGVQIAFVDTPGLHQGRAARPQPRHEPHRRRPRSTMPTSWCSWSRRCTWTEEDELVLERIRDSGHAPSPSSTRSTGCSPADSCCRSWRSSRRSTTFSTSCRCRR